MLPTLRTRPRADSRLRCAVCHDALVTAASCPGCATRLHDDCRALLAGACPTRGCPGEPAPRPAGPRLAVALPLLLVAAWALAGWAVWAWPAEPGSLVREFDQALLRALWAMAGPLLAATALDHAGARASS